MTHNGSTNAFDESESFLRKSLDQVIFVRKLAKVTYASATWHTWKMKHERKYPPIKTLQKWTPVVQYARFCGGWRQESNDFCSHIFQSYPLQPCPALPELVKVTTPLYLYVMCGFMALYKFDFNFIFNFDGRKPEVFIRWWWQEHINVMSAATTQFSGMPDPFPLSDFGEQHLVQTGSRNSTPKPEVTNGNRYRRNLSGYTYVFGGRFFTDVRPTSPDASFTQNRRIPKVVITLWLIVTKSER